MSINSESKPEFSSEKNLQAPFGRRLYDEAVKRKIRSVAQMKFWGFTLFFLTTVYLFLFTVSDRVERFTPREMEFEVKTVTSRGDEIIVPALVLEYKRPQGLPQWAKIRPSPIMVLSFIGDKKIPPGAEAKAVLLTGATNGLIKARLIENLKVDGVTLLDAGVLLMGQGRSTDERLFVDFKKAVFRNGKFVPISAQAYDFSDSILGLKGSRVGDISLKLAASSGLHFLSGLAAGLETPATDNNGKPRRPKLGDAALNGVSTAASEQARGYMEEVKQKPPLIEVKVGTVFLVTFDGGDE